MKHTTSAISMKYITKLLALFRKTILAGFMAAAIAVSMAGCNGKIYASLFEDDLMDLLPFLGPSIESIAITPTAASTPSGVPVDFDVIATLSNGKTRELTSKEMGRITWGWVATGTALINTSDVTIQNAVVPAVPVNDTLVRVTAIKDNYLAPDASIRITATFRELTADADLTINDAELVSIDVTPGTATITRLATQQFTATGTFTDGGDYDVTNAACIVWSATGGGTIATIDGGGKATGVGAGPSTITASDGAGISDSATLQVTDPLLLSVTVSPVTKTIAAGTYVQYRATAIYDNNTTQDVTEAADWTTGSGSVATVDNDASKGLAHGVSAGSTTVTATFDAEDGDAAINVTGETLEYLVISAAGARTSIAAGTKLQFAATGVYSDNSTQDLTDDPGISWGSASPLIAAFNTGTDPSGLIAGLSAGSTVVSASIGAVDSQDYDLAVTAATLQAILISPRDPVAYVIAYGTTQQFTVTGTFSDATTQDLTTQVTWHSSDDTVANIDANGLATTATTIGTTSISATFTNGTEFTDATTLQVISMPLSAITITPSSRSTYVGATFQYAAMGTFTDPGNGNTYNIDITNLVVWDSDNAALTVSNSAGSYGLATPLSAGSANVTARRGTAPVVTSNTSPVTIAASDTTAPTIVSAQLMTGDRVKVTFSEPMDYSTAMQLANYKVATTATVVNSCASPSDNSNFTGTTESISVTSVAFFTQSVYILQLAGGTSATQYTVIGDRDDLRDVAGAPNELGCPNTATFNGIDTVKPYLVSVVNSEPTKLIVKYSEPMTTGGGTTAADNMSNYTLAEDPSNGIPEDDVSISGITMIDESTFMLTLNKTTLSIRYRITVAAGVTDQAPTPNTMGSPRALTFIGNEALKVVSAVATDLTHIKVTFSKPVLSGNGVTNSAECDDATVCHTKYKLYPRTAGDAARLGEISSAVRGTGNETNTVILTHSIEQDGIAYTVIAANNDNGDGFDDEPVQIKAEAGTDDFMQASPKDRATFTGLGNVVDTFTEGNYFDDPFGDGSIFSWAFNYDDKVYLGTNDENTGAFRFDPNGYNSTLISFNFDFTLSNTADTIGFGWDSTAAAPSLNLGPDGEYGVVGFTSAAVNPNGAGEREILMAGPLKNGVNYFYFTEDVDSTLDWRYGSLSITGGNNTASVQTMYAYGDHLYAGIASQHGSQSPLISVHNLDLSGGNIIMGASNDMVVRSLAYIGRNAGGNSNPAADADAVVGIDCMFYVPSTLTSPTPVNTLYIANNGGVAAAAGEPTSYASFTSFISQAWLAAQTISGTPSYNAGDVTLVLPDALEDVDPNYPAGTNGLGKLSPGQKGVPFLVIFNGRMYMARNLAVAQTANDETNRNGAELWKCDANCTTNTNWKPIASSAIFTGGANNKAISMLIVNNNRLYIGFDNATNGITVFRSNDGVTDINSDETNDDGASDFTLQDEAGFGGNFTSIISSTSISDGTDYYLYLIAGDGVVPFKVFRQKD